MLTEMDSRDGVASTPIPSAEFRVYPQRFWILFLYSFLTFNQCMFWLTFSPIASSTIDFYHVDEATVDLLLNWGPIIFLPTLPLVYLTLNSHHGLRKCLLTYAVVSVVATALRLLPSWITSPSAAHFHDTALPLLHFAQILIAATGPMAMALASQLSCLWFPLHERTRATTIAVLSASLGGAVAFLVSPHLVTEASQVPHLLYLHTAQAFLACLLTLVYCPGEPPSPPSSAARLILVEQSARQEPVEALKRLLSDLLQCCRDRSCILLVLAGGILGGTMTAWVGILATVLKPLGYSEPEAGECTCPFRSSPSFSSGWFGFFQTISSITGGLIIGSLADRPRFQRSLKWLMLSALIISFVVCALFQMSVETVFWPSHPPLPSSVAVIGCLFSLIGLFSGAASPLIYECLAEMMYPLPESLTASIYVEIYNLVSLVFVAIAPNRYQLMNLLVLLLMGVSIVMIGCARVTYKRKDEEQLKKLTVNRSTEELVPI